VVQILINYKWSIIKPKVFSGYLYPYLAFLLTFSAWSNFLYEQRDNGDALKDINYALIFMLLGFSLYFFLGEVRQFLLTGCSYFLDAWNYLDIIPLILVAITAGWAGFDMVFSGEAADR
jgi:hypothetical protein